MIHTIIHIPVWQYVLEIAIVTAFSIGGVYLFQYLKRLYRKATEIPVKRLSAEVTPEFHAEVKAFVVAVPTTMKDFIIESVKVRMEMLTIRAVNLAWAQHMRRMDFIDKEI